MTRHKLVRDYDRAHNSPRALEVSERAQETKQICLQCRRVPDERAIRLDWYDTEGRAGRMRQTWPGLGGVCPSCAGRLVEITW